MVTGRLVMEVPLLAFRKLESNPFTVELVMWAGTHGEEKVDWVTVWLPWVTVGGKCYYFYFLRRIMRRNVQLKKTMSFSLAVALSGEKTAPGFPVVLPPMVITMVSAHAEAIRAETWTIIWY